MLYSATIKDENIHTNLWYEICLFIILFFLLLFFFTADEVFIYLFIYFTILYWFCHTSTWIHHRYTRVPHPEPSSHLPPHLISLGCPARTWKQPRCPSADEWIRKLWYIYTMEYYSAIKKYIWISSNEVDETGAYYTEWSKPERKTPIQYTNAYIWNLERW